MDPILEAANSALRALGKGPLDAEDALTDVANGLHVAADAARACDSEQAFLRLDALAMLWLARRGRLLDAPPSSRRVVGALVERAREAIVAGGQEQPGTAADGRAFVRLRAAVEPLLAALLISARRE